jgi:hypothetical protein
MERLPQNADGDVLDTWRSQTAQVEKCMEAANRLIDRLDRLLREDGFLEKPYDPASSIP